MIMDSSATPKLVTFRALDALTLKPFTVLLNTQYVRWVTVADDDQPYSAVVEMEGCRRFNILDNATTVMHRLLYTTRRENEDNQQ